MRLNAFRQDQIQPAVAVVGVETFRRIDAQPLGRRRQRRVIGRVRVDAGKALERFAVADSLGRAGHKAATVGRAGDRRDRRSRRCGGHERHSRQCGGRDRHSRQCGGRERRSRLCVGRERRSRRCGSEQRFAQIAGQLHPFAHAVARPIPLDHRELGIVKRPQFTQAKHAGNLVDRPGAGRQQPLHGELRRSLQPHSGGIGDWGLGIGGRGMSVRRLAAGPCPLPSAHCPLTQNGSRCRSITVSAERIGVSTSRKPRASKNSLSRRSNSGAAASAPSLPKDETRWRPTATWLTGFLICFCCGRYPKVVGQVANLPFSRQIGNLPHGRKRGQAPFAGTALRVLRTNGACPLFPL